MSEEADRLVNELIDRLEEIGDWQEQERILSDLWQEVKERQLGTFA